MPAVKTRKKHKATRLEQLRKSVWFFPAILTVCLLLLTSLQISGSSIGIYDSYLNGADHKNSDLLFGAPQPIRSDEWLVNTQLTIAQYRDGFNHINENITDGRDMSLNIDVPYKEWSIIFKPQNLAFLVLPVEFAFALKWWLLLYLLIIGGYFFTLRIFPGKRLLAAMIGLGFALSPFVFWWYQTFTLATLFYGFFIMILGMRILNKEPVKLLKRTLGPKASFALYTLLLTYLLVCFALVFYPPFQVPVALVVAAFLFGYALQLRQKQKVGAWLKQLVRPLAIVGLACLMTVVIGLSFALTRQSALHSVTHTVYPGARVVTSGGYPLDRMLATFLQPQLQRGAHGSNYYMNQSESSNFILLLPYLLPAGLALLAYEYRRYRRVDWVFVLLHGVIALFLANMFIPGGQTLYHLLLLDKVPHERLIIGLGFAGIIYTLLLMHKVSLVKIGRHKQTILAALYALACLAVALLVGKYTREHFPLFISSWVLIGGAAVFFSSIIYALLIRRFVLAAGLLLFFSILSTAHIHPLYRGLDPVLNNKVVQAMQSVSKPEDTWVSLDQIYLENFGLMADRDSLTGVQFYPDLTFWRQVEGKQADDIYNRYAHVIFTANPDFPQIKLQQLDSFIVRFDCSDFNRKHVDFVLTSQRLYYGCTRQISEVTYPAQTFYLYRVD
jgi:hypothetical protein